MFWAQGAIFVSLIIGIASEGNPWGLGIDRAELDAIKEALREERGLSYEQDAPIFADPIIGQLGSNGGHCITPCAKNGRSYASCETDKDPWDYCSPNNGFLTAYSRECKSECARMYGKKYTWCWTKTGTWDYCVPS